MSKNVPCGYSSYQKKRKKKYSRTISHFGIKEIKIVPLAYIVDTEKQQACLQQNKDLNYLI